MSMFRGMILKDIKQANSHKSTQYSPKRNYTFNKRLEQLEETAMKRMWSHIDTVIQWPLIVEQLVMQSYERIGNILFVEGVVEYIDCQHNKVEYLRRKIYYTVNVEDARQWSIESEQ